MIGWRVIPSVSRLLRGFVRLGRLKLPGSALVGVILAGSCWGSAFESRSIPVSDGQACLEIDSTDKLLVSSAAPLVRYWREVTAVEPVLMENQPQGRGGCAVVISFAVSDIPYFLQDGFKIITDLSLHPPEVQILAPSLLGIRNAVQQLIQSLTQEERTLRLSHLDVAMNPALKRRELFVAEIEWHPTPGEEGRLEKLRSHFSWLNWRTDRLRDYIDMAAAMGYNAVMLSDAHLMRRYAGESTSHDEGLQKVREMLARAREIGLGRTFFLWGQQGTKDDLPVPNPRDSEQYGLMEDNWDLMIGRYGDSVDHWVLHWADPGGCTLGDCTVNTPQVATNQFLAALRARGHQEPVSFSLWGLRWGAWPGYHDWHDVVDSGILDPEVGVAMMRSFDSTAANAIVRQGRMAGVWGWYANDLEVNPGLHVHSRILQNEFNRLDSSASTLIDWFSLEDNNHVLNLPSLYVGGRLLWNPKGSGSEYLSDFCRAVWGRSVGPIVLEALKAIETVRCGSGDPMTTRDLWPDGYLCRLGWGRDDPQDDLDVCNRALDALTGVEVEPGHVPQITLVVEPSELLFHIRAHLEYVRAFADFRVQYLRALEPALKAHDFTATQNRMASLPELPSDIPDSYGALEFLPYQFWRRFADSWADRTFDDNLALGKPVSASSVYNGDPRFAPGMAVNGILCELREEGWAADQPGEAWLEIDLERAELVREVRVYNRGYERENWDNKRAATPSGFDVYLSETREPAAYKHVGSVRGWESSSDPSEFKSFVPDSPMRARFVRVVLQAPSNGDLAGSGEIEVR